MIKDNQEGTTYRHSAMEPMKMKHGTSDEDLFNDLMEHVGMEGKFQSRFNYLYNLALMVLVAMPALNIIMALTSPDHWCHVPGRNETNFTLSEWKQLTVPRTDATGNVDTFSKCSAYNLTFPLDANTSRPTLLERTPSDYRDTVSCQDGWEYDQTWFASTVTSQEDWVCEKELHIPNTLLFCKVGEVLGEVFIGQLGDTIGRRPVLFLGVALLVLGRCVLVFSAGIYTIFLAAVVVTSLPTGVIFQSPLIIGMEVSSARQRAHIALLQCVGWTLGMAVTPLVAWAVGGHWKVFMVLTTLPCAAVFFVFRCFPESPRWLVAKGKTRKCLKVLNQIAKENGTSLPENTMETLQKLERRKEKVYGVLSLFTNRRLLRITILISSCVTLVQLLNYTLVLSIATMSGNPFLNMFLQALVEIPGFLLGRFVCNRFGRRWSQAGAYSVAAFFQIGCLITVTHQQLLWLLISLVMIVKFSLTVAAYCAYLQCMELYPTCLRQTGTSLGVLLATLIATFSPYIVYLGAAVDRRYPYAILIVLCLLGIACGTLLPETLNQKLPDTVDEAADFGAEQKFWSFPQRKPATQYQSAPTKHRQAN
ncbi:solute carrier family 22 member 5 isoform X2 [Cryptotermes secundus]|uniref:solute carrier family 22 member 5 isoform X2 n=1 Tax=Cryptotermes secundus TaxID=105785 RepID=UPI000CD7ADF4|nr:solute carrier family 22 member 5 isoform X2 [Cryptotermes secundus]